MTTRLKTAIQIALIWGLVVGLMVAGDLYLQRHP